MAGPLLGPNKEDYGIVGYCPLMYGNYQVSEKVLSISSLLALNCKAFLNCLGSWISPTLGHPIKQTLERIM